MRSKALLYLAIVCFVAFTFAAQAQQRGLAVSVDSHGNYEIGLPGSVNSVLLSGVAAKVDNKWLHSADYPRHALQKTTVQGFLGAAVQWQVAFTGLSGEPDLVYQLRAYAAAPFVDLRMTVRNSTGHAIHVQDLRSIEAEGPGVPALNGPAEADRVLSDSFSEDRPAMQIHDLGDAPEHMHRAVGSQLIYNRTSRQSLFVGALTSDRFLTILRLHIGDAGHITEYEVDSTGTTEMEKENSLQNSPAADQVELSLPVGSGGALSSEALLIGAGTDYHHQLETYGALIRRIHHAHVSAPPLMGWWSWTAYYFGLNEGAALTNAQWEAEHLRPFGYDVFHIDEGYQYARGEYITPNTAVFPHGLMPVEYKIRGLGLLPGIWTAPFEVSVRSSVYQQHRDWLVKNAKGEPIHAGYVVGRKDPLYILDTTNPGAQSYLRQTYTKLVHDWGIHYIKLDFMDDSAIEGYYYRPHTTAMEAQRIGLQIIRQAVGDQVYLDKDGSVMLNPVGYVDYGRISQDTGHSFGASRDAATGMAARYYMNRNFFVADPDAFTVSTQRISDQSWHEGKQPLTLREAQVSIALAAVSGGMLEIGDNLPSLQGSPERIALIENRDLIDMVRLGKASVPIDLMSYDPADRQPSVFYLKESPRQSILTVFNWTEHPRPKTIRLSELGLFAPAYHVTDIFNHKELDVASGALSFVLMPHSVRVLRIINPGVQVEGPAIAPECPSAATAGESLNFSASVANDFPALSFDWDFADGVRLEGGHVSHAWTEPGDYMVRISAQGLEGAHSEKKCAIHVTGYLPSVFAPEQNRRYQPQ